MVDHRLENGWHPGPGTGRMRARQSRPPQRLMCLLSLGHFLGETGPAAHGQGVPVAAYRIAGGHDGEALIYLDPSVLPDLVSQALNR
jgi:hypothetical protein